jgi:hypothetical protein
MRLCSSQVASVTIECGERSVWLSLRQHHGCMSTQSDGAIKNSRTGFDG